MSKPSKTRAAKTPATREAPGGTQADFDAFLPAAKKVLAAEVVPCRADTYLAVHNVRIGVASVLGAAARAAKVIPETDLAEIAALPSLALAVDFAATQLGRPAGPAGLAADIARCNVLRALLLRAAETLVLAGLLPADDVAEIKKGHGKVDAARDLGALVALFGRHESKVHGKHPVTAAEMREAAVLGASLLAVLKPGGARVESRKATIGVDERDRLWTLLVQSHDRLWRAGAYLFGRAAADAKVPPLRSARRRLKKPPVPTPIAA